MDTPSAQGPAVSTLNIPIRLLRGRPLQKNQKKTRNYDRCSLNLCQQRSRGLYMEHKRCWQCGPTVQRGRLGDSKTEIRIYEKLYLLLFPFSLGFCFSCHERLDKDISSILLGHGHLLNVLQLKGQCYFLSIWRKTNWTNSIRRKREHDGGNHKHGHKEI